MPASCARALKHADAVVVGEAELVIEKLLDDLEQGAVRGVYRADRLHPMTGLPMPRYDLIKKNRYVNRTFVQTSRGCRQGCTFCAEPLLNGLKVRYRPVDEVMREIDHCGCRTISINDADFFGSPERPTEIMRALKGRGIRWQAAANSKLAQDDRLLELAADSGCTMLSIGFESISRDTLASVHKGVNRPETFAALVEKVHSYGIMVFGLFMFGFDGDDPSVFQRTARFNIQADLDVCALFRADTLSGHAHLVQDEEGRPYRFLRLGQVQPGQRGLPAGADAGRGAPPRPDRGLRDFLRPSLPGPPLSALGPASRLSLVRLQPLHEEGRRRLPQYGGRRNGAAGGGAGAADPPSSAPVAAGGAGGDRRRGRRRKPCKQRDGGACAAAGWAAPIAGYPTRRRRKRNTRLPLVKHRSTRIPEQTNCLVVRDHVVKDLRRLYGKTASY